MHVRSPLHNTILPQKIYGIWDGNRKLDEIPANSPTEALTLARGKWGAAASAAIRQAGRTSEANFEGRTEPMFS